MWAALLGGLDRLAIHDGGAERLVTIGLEPHSLVEAGIEPLEEVTQVPKTKVAVGSKPVGQIMRKHAQSAARTKAVEDVFKEPRSETVD